jgi:hypothetical protein
MEVLLGYPNGRKYRPVIAGAVYSYGFKAVAGGGTGATMSGYNRMSQQIETIINEVPLVILDNLNTQYGATAQGDFVNTLLPKAKVHSALSGAELHDPKAHTHSGDTVSPSNINDVNSIRCAIISSDRSMYESEGTMIIWDSGVYKALVAYVNSSWQEIKRFS